MSVHNQVDDPTTVRRLRELFDECDADHDGLISRSEMDRMLVEKGFADTSERERLNDVFQRMDLDGNGSINFGEFKTGIIQVRGALSRDRSAYTEAHHKAWPEYCGILPDKRMLLTGEHGKHHASQFPRPFTRSSRALRTADHPRKCCCLPKAPQKYLHGVQTLKRRRYLSTKSPFRRRKL